MKRIYIAGPYTGKDPRESHLNVQAAIKVACAVIRKGVGALYTASHTLRLVAP